ERELSEFMLNFVTYNTRLAAVSENPQTRQHHLHRRGARLRLIVPLAAGEDYRSWLGGCPHLPDPFSWPQRDGKPLHFVGQIDCAALPPGIWGDLAQEPAGWRSSSGWRQRFVPKSSMPRNWVQSARRPRNRASISCPACWALSRRSTTKSRSGRWMSSP